MKSHYDVAIAGFWYGANYGSLLNGYAMYKTIKSFGKSVLMIQKPNASDTDVELIQGHNVDFIKKYYDPEDISPSLPYERLGELNNICDCFCAGSDQIWNYTLSFAENMYLPFVHDEKKIISFATSFGHKIDKTPDNVKPRIRKYLSRYNAISVREHFDVNILKENYGLEGELVFEPVFCIDKSIYDNLAENSNFNETEPYLLTYILDATPQKREAICFYAKKTGLKVINILDGVKSRREVNEKILDLPNILDNVSVGNFLKAFKGASYVITDSFHGTAFSIIFEKNFISIGNNNRGLERFIDLLDRLKLSHRLASDPQNIPLDEKFLQPIDYTETNKIIAREAQKTVEWVRNAIETPKEKLKSISLKKNVTTELNKTFCTGCGACVSVCPVDALSLQPDDLGYYRSTVDSDKCVQCGKCTKICPAIKLPEKTNSSEPELYEFIVKDEKVLFNSSSGGAFPMLAAEAFKNGGVVFGAAWRDDFSVEHIMIDNPNDLHKLQKSKYLQSYLGDTFRKVKEKLEQNIFVLFSGCPCQVAGLNAFLGKNYDNLITVDLLCGNCPSTMFFKKYIKQAFPDGLEKYEFRHKSEGWNADCNAITTNGIVSIKRGGKQDNYQRIYHNHTMCPPHCEKCKYQAVPRFGDITIGDFWWLNDKDKTVDVSRGVSAVLCNNEKGKKFFEKIPDEKLSVRKQVLLEWLRGNGHAINGAHNWCSPNRNDFYKAIETMPFKEAIEYAMKPNHGVKPPRGMFNFSAKETHFNFNPSLWNESYINGAVVLSTREAHPKPGNYAVMPLNCTIKAGETYILKMRFKISTDSKVYNFHLKSAGESFYQIIYSHKVTPDDSTRWVEISHKFQADSDIYDEFMIGAAQLSGENRWVALDYVMIDKL